MVFEKRAKLLSYETPVLLYGPKENRNVFSGREYWSGGSEVPRAREGIVRLFSAVFLIAVYLSACAVTSDRPISSRDRIFGTLPGGETVLRLKVPCSVPSDGGSIYLLPVGDYTPISADSQGIFYEVPRSVELRRGEKSVWIWGLGVHFPFGGRPSSHPSVWLEGVDLERGSVIRAKRWALPQPCWQPYGTTMTIVHKGVEVSSRHPKTTLTGPYHF